MNIDLKQAVLTSTYIIKGGFPILEIYNDDGYQFLGGQVIVDSDAMVVALEDIISLDKEIMRILPLLDGYVASRKDKNSDWNIKKIF